MTNYGLPLRFKAVEIATGKEVPTSKLVLDPADGQWYACYGGDTIHFDEEWVTEIQLYQSTGHHDANGTEVFFGAVVVCECCGCILVVCSVDSGDIVLSKINDRTFVVHSIAVIDEMIIIGNIHHSREELERRAQEVRA